MDVIAYKQGIFNSLDNNIFGVEFLARFIVAGSAFKSDINIAWDEVDINMVRQITNIKDFDLKHQVEIFINVSNSLLSNRVKFEHWQDLIKSINDHENIRCVVEVTEDVCDSVLMDNFLHLKNTGSKIALDDFGSSYSTIDRLEMFIWDYCKFDANQLGDEIVVRAINVCRNKSITTVAEQIANIELLEAAKKSNINLYQGYYLEKPSKTCLYY